MGPFVDQKFFKRSFSLQRYERNYPALEATRRQSVVAESALLS
jgi:hypothetical protein